ncbi:Retrovirus-related Pol polyprotein from transposon TNT 1-94 [Bienertia sinuspersici]
MDQSTRNQAKLKINFNIFEIFWPKNWGITREVYLENQFNLIHLNNFPDISSYCQKLKTLKDQLAPVDQEVNEQKMVLRLIAGLINTDYDTPAQVISQMEPLPNFETARSKLLLEETRKANDNSNSAATFLMQHPDYTASSPSSNSPQP